VRSFRDRFSIPISDSDLEHVPLIKPAPDSREAAYLRDRSAKFGAVPTRRRNVEPPLAVPERAAFAALQPNRPASARSPPRWRSCAPLSTILRDKTVGPRVVPIVADESRTFGMEGMFRQLGIYSNVGQLYRPQTRIN